MEQFPTYQYPQKRYNCGGIQNDVIIDQGNLKMLTCKSKKNTKGQCTNMELHPAI